MALFVRVNPALGAVLVTCLAPEVRAAVDGVGAEYDARAARDALPGDGGVADGLADGGGHGGVQAEDLLADTVEERHGF